MQADELVEFSGRVCYMSFGDKQSPRNNNSYIKNIIKNGHESILEHAVWSFFVTGVTRSFSHQLVRHRVGFSFSQLSQQYHDESDAEFIPPIGLDPTSLAYEVWNNQTALAKKVYNKSINKMIGKRNLREIPKEELRLIRETSRSLLPNCTETKVAVTANARAIRNFLKIRGVIEGDLEMRFFSTKLLSLLKPEAPAIFHDLEVIEKHSDGYPIIRVNI